MEMHRNVPNALTMFARGALDTLLPPSCPSCRAPVMETHGVCATCWEQLTFLSDPQCQACGHPFEFEVEENALCMGCARDLPPFERARAALLYTDASKDLILAFKHADRTNLAPMLAKWMSGAGAELLRDAEVIVPVPLHWSRLFARRYNQAALLARALATLSATPFCADSLSRIKRTRSQGHLSVRGRDNNVRHAFRVPPPKLSEIKDKRVLLVDDVMTTGATAGWAAKALLRAGAQAVDVLTLARVVRSVA